MAHVHAGDVVTLTIDGKNVEVKIEDASKSESVMAKVQASQASDFHVGQVYEFARNML